MKFYKFVNPLGHNGMVYKEGLNTDILPFNPKGDCAPGGIYFSREDILAFICYGEDLYEVEPIGETYENPCSPIKWKAHQVDLKYLGKRTDLKALQNLIDDGAVVRIGALTWAAKTGQLEIARFLIDEGADIITGNNNALRAAAVNGYIDIVKLFLEKGARKDQHLLTIAASYGRIEIIQLLVKHGYDIRASNDEALCWAAGYGQLEIVKFLFMAGVGIVELETSLIAAARGGHNEVVKFLLKHGVDIHAREDAALWKAAFNGRLETVKLLLKKGASINAACEHGTALLAAIQHGDIKVVRFLLKNGADINTGTHNHLKAAVISGSPKILKLLLDAGADIQDQGAAALRAAAAYGQYGSVKNLLENGADVLTLGRDTLDRCIYPRVTKLLKKAIAAQNDTTK